MKYVLEAVPEVREKGIVFGFDGRHNSDKYDENRFDNVILLFLLVICFFTSVRV